MGGCVKSDAAFGFDYLNHQLVKNSAEQATIRMMRQYRAAGLSLRDIAGNLNQMFIRTKKDEIWQANNVEGDTRPCVIRIAFRPLRGSGGLFREPAGVYCVRTP